AGAAAAPAAEGAARPGDNHPQVPGQGAAPPLRYGRGARGGPATLPGRRADRGPTDAGLGTRSQVGAAAAGGGGGGGPQLLRVAGRRGRGLEVLCGPAPGAGGRREWADGGADGGGGGQRATEARRRGKG